MELNNLPNVQSNSSANVAAAAVPSLKQDVATQQVAPAKKSSDSDNEINREEFSQESIIQDAIKKKIIKVDEKDLFNYRVTRFDDNLTFTNLITGEISSVNMRSVVGDNAVNAAI